MSQLKLKAIAGLVILALMPSLALALEFRSVAVPKAILFDAPSGAAKKILLLSQDYPVEIVVNLGEWLKVRDAQGSVSWVEAKQLSAKRSVMVNVNAAELRQSAEVGAKLVATLQKDLILDIVDTKPTRGWLKVKHRDGATGYILISSIWGFN